MAKFAVILPAAGKSTRFKDRDKKPFSLLDGRAVWLRAAELFVTRDDVCQCILVLAREDREMFRVRHQAHIAFMNLTIADGGAERFESVANALKLVQPEADLVAVHDAVRPCVTEAQVNAVFAEAARTGAALLGVPVSDTVKQVDGQRKVTGTLPRQGLWLAQTPQVFRRDWLLAAYAARDRLGTAITDDAQLVEATGHAVHLVPGSAANRKITTREDLLFAEAVLKGITEPAKPRR